MARKVYTVKGKKLGDLGVIEMDGETREIRAFFDILEPKKLANITDGDQLRMKLEDTIQVLDILLVRGKWIFERGDGKMRMWLMVECDKWRETVK